MFVPCDLDGNVLVKPLIFYLEQDMKRLKGIELEIANSVNNRAKEYKEAKDRCLFEGFEYRKMNRENIWYLRDTCTGHIVHIYEHLTVEGQTDLKEKYLLTLTPTALKNIGL